MRRRRRRELDPQPVQVPGSRASSSASPLSSRTICASVLALARNERRRAAVQGGIRRILPPMGLVFGLVVGFLAAQVWTDSNEAQAAVNRQASALRARSSSPSDIDLAGNAHPDLSTATSRRRSPANGRRWRSNARR